jgi:hypothetical protein
MQKDREKESPSLVAQSDVIATNSVSIVGLRLALPWGDGSNVGAGTESLQGRYWLATCVVKFVNLSWGLFQAIEASIEVADPRCPIGETQGLSDKDVIFKGGIQEGDVDVHKAEVNIHCSATGEHDTHACHANDGGERFSVINALPLTASFLRQSAL